MQFKKIFFLLFTSTVLPIWGDVDIDQTDVGSEQIEKPSKSTPFSLNTRIDVVAPTKIKKGFCKKETVNFATAQIEGGAIFYYCPTYTEGARIGLGYSPTYLRWAENLWFYQDHFNILNLSLSGFTKRIDKWFWRTQLTINFDTDKWDFAFTSYDILLWGRYDYSKNIGVHVGVWVETGLQMDRVYPILGFDWQISRKWKLNLVYPVNISLDYSLTKSWILSLAGRFFDSRFRAHEHKYIKKPLVRYTNTGVELAIKYDTDLMSANIHAGTTLGGNYRVANRGNSHAENFKLKPSAYAGGEVTIKF